MEPKALTVVLLDTTAVENSSPSNQIFNRVSTSKQISRSDTHDVAELDVFGYSVTIHKTPRLSDTTMNDEEMKQIFEKPGPCVYLLVLKAERFTEEQRGTVQKIKRLLGEDHLEKTWILFINVHQLEERNMTITEFIRESEALEDLVQRYDQRYYVLNNRTEEDGEKYFTMLLGKMIQTSLGLKASKGGRLPRIMPSITNSAPGEQHSPDSGVFSRRIVLLGKTGSGKSAAGNMILNENKFKSVMRLKSVTSECSEAYVTFSGRSVSVIDTPGFFDTEIKSEELAVEIARSVYLSSPGPHAFLIVFPINMRYTEHEQQIPQNIEMMFGEEVLKYSIILLTHGDQLDGESVEDLIKEDVKFRSLVDQCGGRYQVFNNKDQSNREQVNDLLKKIDSMVEQNGGGHYSNQMYEYALRFRQEEEKRKQDEKEKAVGQEENEIRQILPCHHEFDHFFREYEERFSFSASLMSHLKTINLGALVGGTIGAVLGIAAGPAGVIGGAAAGAATGAAIAAIRTIFD